MDYSLTGLFWTDFEIWVFGDHEELVDLFVVFLDVGWEGVEEGGVGIEGGSASFMRAVDLLEGLDLIDGVVVQAGLAEVLHMLALAEMHFLLALHLHDFPLADLTVFDILDSVSNSCQTTTNDAAHLGLLDSDLALWVLTPLFRLLRHMIPQHTLKCEGYSMPNFLANSEDIV